MGAGEERNYFSFLHKLKCSCIRPPAASCSREPPDGSPEIRKIREIPHPPPRLRITQTASSDQVQWAPDDDDDDSDDDYSLASRWPFRNSIRRPGDKAANWKRLGARRPRPGTTSLGDTFKSCHHDRRQRYSPARVINLVGSCLQLGRATWRLHRAPRVI